TNEPVSDVASVSAASAKIAVSALPNVDTLSNAEGILEKMDLLPWYLICQRWSATTATGKGTLQESAEEEPPNYALMAFTSLSSSSSDNEVASCSKAYTKAYATLQSHYDKLTNDLRKSQFDVISYKTGLESVEARLLVYQQNKYVFEEDIKLLKLDVQLRDNALVVLRQKFKKAEQERDDLKLKLEKFQTSSKNLRAGYHAVPPLYTGTFMPPKPNLVFHDAPNVNEIILTAFNVSNSEDDSEAELPRNAPSFVQPTKQVKTHRPSVKPVENSIPAANHKTAIPKPKTHRNIRNRKACFVCKSLTHLIKDVLTRSKLVSLTAARPVPTDVPQPHVTRPRPAKTVVTKPYSPPRRNINYRPSPKPYTFPLKVTTVKAPMVNADKGVQGNWVWKPKCPILDHVSHHTSASMTLKRFDYNDPLGRSKHMTGKMSYLSDFEEINDGYVAFGGNTKGGKITGKGKIRTGSGPTWLFDIDTLTKSINYQPVNAGNQSIPSTGVQEQFDAEKAGEDNVQQYVLFPLWSSGSKDHQNTKMLPLKLRSLSLKSMFLQARSLKISLITALMRLMLLVLLFLLLGQISTNNTNTFSAAGPSNTTVSPTHRKSSYMDPSQYPDDPNMPTLEDITYSDDEEDVGAEADFTNLETNITVSPILITRVHKDHPVSQIIGDLSSATQTRCMTKVVKDQGGLTRVFYTP
nr:hypothetical protein [Tanacetum cinerariifolium]